MTDTEIKTKGLQSLIDNLGLVEAERFFVIIRREGFDYSEWRKNLFVGKSIKDISREAMDYQKSLKTNHF